MKLLHKFGANLNIQNKIGLSPMHVAAQNDKPFPLTYLQAHGVDVDCLDNEG